jgi:hypothetical protein
MPLERLTLESLKLLDAGGVAAVDQLMSRVALDCLDRPGDTTSRTIDLKMAFKPVIDPDGSCSEVKVQIQAVAKLPSYKTKVRSLGARQMKGGGMFVFQPDAPDNVNQGSLLPEDEEDE